MPLGFLMTWRNWFRIRGGMPMRSSDSPTLELSSTRMTTDSPNSVGKTETRKSMRDAADVQLDAAVLRHPPLGDVEVRHDFNAAGDGVAEVPRRRDHFQQHAVALVAHFILLLERLEVDVRRAVADRHQQHHVDELAHGCRVGEFRDVVEVDTRLAACCSRGRGRR